MVMILVDLMILRMLQLLVVITLAIELLRWGVHISYFHGMLKLPVLWMHHLGAVSVLHMLWYLMLWYLAMLRMHHLRRSVRHMHRYDVRTCRLQLSLQGSSLGGWGKGGDDYKL
jgi:hypothetical protein